MEARLGRIYGDAKWIKKGIRNVEKPEIVRYLT